DRGPLLAQEAVEAKLVDRLGYRDEVLGHARARAGSGAEVISLANYLDRAGHPHREGSTIALIYGSGLVVRSGGGANPLTGSNLMAATELTRAFRAAVRDPAVRAIIFRIDSPGGSAVASESIWREVVFARERGKPVIVSMSDVAGSGGYYVAAAADKIVDELGGYAVGLRLAKEAANLPPEAPFTLTVFPREETLPELLYKRLTGEDRERDAGGITSTSIEHSLKAMQPLLQRLEAVLDSPGVLTMPPLGPIR